MSTDEKDAEFEEMALRIANITFYPDMSPRAMHYLNYANKLRAAIEAPLLAEIDGNTQYRISAGKVVQALQDELSVAQARIKEFELLAQAYALLLRCGGEYREPLLMDEIKLELMK